MHNLTMSRFKTYIILLVLNASIYFSSLLLNIEYVSGVINFLSFLGSIIFLLFTFEEPPLVSKLKIPEVHSRYRSAQNNYNNLLAIEFALISFLFYILHYSTGLSLSIVVLGLWFLSVPLTYFVILLNTKDKQLELIVDYIRFSDGSLDEYKVKDILRQLIKLNSTDKDILIAGVKVDDSALLQNIVDLYLHYLSSYQKSLTAGEVKEINDL